MSGNTNPTEELELDGFGDGFDDVEYTTDVDDDVDDEPSADPANTEVPPEQTKVNENAEKPTEETAPKQDDPFNIKYMGKEMALTPDELRTYAQKGMDYDRIREERDSFKASPELDAVHRISAAMGMSVTDVAQFIEQRQREQAVQEQVQQGVPEPVARQLAELNRKEQERAAADRNAVQENAARKLYSDFVTEYPDVKEFPDEVKSAIAAGDTPVAAYRAYENKQLKLALAAAEQTAKNRAVLTGSLTGDAPPDAGDSFMDGFNGEF